jgi:ABC-type methionine transport system ATPase subunit
MGIAQFSKAGCLMSIGIVEEQRLTRQLIRVRIPKDHHQDPVISRLVSQFQVTVNIMAAVLGGNAKGDGWFALELRGTQSNIQSALTYLRELDLEVWDGAETNGW